MKKAPLDSFFRSSFFFNRLASVLKISVYFDILCCHITYYGFPWFTVVMTVPATSLSYSFLEDRHLVMFLYFQVFSFSTKSSILYRIFISARLFQFILVYFTSLFYSSNNSKQCRNIFNHAWQFFIMEKSKINFSTSGS